MLDDDVAGTRSSNRARQFAGQPKRSATLDNPNCVPISADSLAYQWQSSADNVTFLLLSTDAINQTYVLTAGGKMITCA